jgi:hypothetical protein
MRTILAGAAVLIAFILIAIAGTKADNAAKAQADTRGAGPPASVHVVPPKGIEVTNYKLGKDVTVFQWNPPGTSGACVSTFWDGKMSTSCWR